MGSSVDPGWEVIQNMREEIVMPFLWAQDGFDEPSEEVKKKKKSPYSEISKIIFSSFSDG